MIVPNDNRAAAGRQEGAIRIVDLEVRPGRWFPEGPENPGEVVLALAEGEGAPRVPGPLIRVREGTRLRISVANRSDRDLLFRGLATRPAGPGDTLHVPAGGSASVEFDVGEAGTYHYWATSSVVDSEDPRPEESTLAGAFVVDPPDAPAEPADRVFVMTVWARAADSTATPAVKPGDMMAINGLSWPHTERLEFQVGDTVRWRWLNPTVDSHPMHLHGFYYDVTSRGTWAADTLYLRTDRRTVVTELMHPGSTMAMEFVPTTPGNWLFHCHFGFHVSHLLSFEAPPEPSDIGSPVGVDHTAQGMRGLMLGISVEDLDRPDPTFPEGARTIRLHALEGPGDYVGGPSYAFAIQARGQSEPAFDRLPPMGPTLVLTRGEPVRIEVVNRLRAPTAVHWHGLEIERAYADGVPGWSGRGDAVAPPAPPGGSFVAEFTPPRAGTFIYHSHSNELLQISSGLYGALIVEDPDRPFDPEREPLVIVGGNGWELFEEGRVNGSREPEPIVMEAGRAHRLRLININPDWRVWIRLKRGDEVLAWRPVAKDGFDLPSHQAVVGAAQLEMGPGETADFEVTTETAGTLALEITTSLEAWSLTQPIEVR